MKKFILLALPALMLISSNRCTAQTKEKVYAVFLVNFGQKIQWPTENPDEEFTIGVLDNPEVASELKTVAKTKSIRNHKISVHEFSDAGKVDYCHILFIPTPHSNRLSSVISKLSDSPTLIVTEKEGLAKRGSIINFLTVDSKLKFELNLALLEKRKMKASTDLKVLSILVE
jgi:hypothetical protein